MFIQKGLVQMLTKIRPFREIMKQYQTAVYSFRYQYNRIQCFVAIGLLCNDDLKLNKAKYALIRLRFMRQENLNHYLDCFANTNGFLTNVGEIREFFEIPFHTEGWKSWLQDFYTDFNNHYPETFINPDHELFNVNIQTVCAHEGRDPNRIYRHHLLRHFPDETGKIKHRTEYNSQLAQWTCPMLWDTYQDDISVSFAFTDDEGEEKTEEEILKNFIRTEESRR